MNSSNRIFVIDDDRSIRWVLEKALKQAQMDVVSFDSAAGVLEALNRAPPDAIITDVRMPGMDGLALLDAIRDRHPDLPVIIMTAHSDLASAVSAYQGGAFEYMPKPFAVDEAVDLARRAISQHHRRPAPANETDCKPTEIFGEAPAMQEVFRASGRLSRSNITVRINGESGTGKELVARALHRHSPRADKPFIALNTAAIPRDLLESELFGHARGAFTGATAARRGRFEQSDGGTLFLDEIGDMPPECQTRLLRVLADGEFYRVGGQTPIKVDVRIIAATHQHLEERVKAGLFREDLFHRLNVIRIHLPALRERREAIPILTRHFLTRAAQEMEMEPKLLRPEVADDMSRRDWPGNGRQRENTCRWLTVMASGREIHLEDLPTELKTQTPSGAGLDWEAHLKHWAEQRLRAGDTGLLDAAVPAFERIMITTALTHTAGRRQDAARLLGWGRNTLTRKIKELGMGEVGGENEDEESTNNRRRGPDSTRCLPRPSSRKRASPHTCAPRDVVKCAHVSCRPLSTRDPAHHRQRHSPLRQHWRRAGLDYHEYARVQVHERCDDFIIAVQPQRLFTCSTRGRTRYSDVHYQAGDTLVLGPETRGLPQELLDTVPAAHRLRIPMVANSRSLNLSNAAAVIVYEAWRQLSFIGGQ